MGSLASNHPEVALRGYVDDFSQFVIGTALHVAICLRFTALQMMCTARVLGLKISELKTCVIASKEWIAKFVVTALALRGLKVGHGQEAKYLGGLLCLHKRRRTKVLQARFVKSRGRLQVVNSLVKVVHSSRKLIRTGSFPVAFWGSELTGVAPSCLAAFRSLVACATGMLWALRCATTAISIAVGQDPACEVVSRMLIAFSAVVCALPSLADVRVAWRRAVARVLCDGRILWQRVHGPLSALVATLAQYSWNPLFVDMWLSPPRTHCSIPWKFPLLCL